MLINLYYVLCKYILQPVLNTFVKETIFVEVKGFYVW